VVELLGGETGFVLLCEEAQVFRGCQVSCQHGFVDRHAWDELEEPRFFVLSIH
jgi:hypothetical protein